MKKLLLLVLVPLLLNGCFIVPVKSNEAVVLEPK